MIWKFFAFISVWWRKIRSGGKTSVTARKDVVARKESRKHVKLGLIECIEAAFDSVYEESVDMSWVSKDTRAAIKKIGPWVPYSASFKKSDVVDILEKRSDSVRSLSEFPSIFVIDHWWNKNDLPENRLAHAMSYGIRLRRPPWDVERMRSGESHVYYETGSKFGSTRSQWVNSYVAINKKSGKVRILDRLTDEKISVKGRDGKVLAQYTRKKRCDPLTEMAPEESWGKTLKDRRDKLVSDFVMDFEWWSTRNRRWSASAKRGNKRVTFSVENEDAKYFFKDRDVTARTATGQKKKIIHYVSSHTRVTKKGVVNVVEHIRGVRAFSWNGYWINVTAPKFHAHSMSNLHISGYDSEDMEPETRHISSGAFAGLIASSEDEGQVKMSGKPA